MKVLKVYRTREEAPTRKGSERLFSVDREGQTWYVVAKSPTEARADTSKFLGDAVTPLERPADAGITSTALARKISALSPEDFAKLKELVG